VPTKIELGECRRADERSEEDESTQLERFHVAESFEPLDRRDAEVAGRTLGIPGDLCVLCDKTS
jgi:hypothetical protein